MEKLKKFIGVLASSLCVSALALAVCVGAAPVKETVRYNEEAYIEHNKNGRYGFVYYDYGTSGIFDNANIQAETSATEDAFIYAEIKYADYGTSKWTNVYDHDTKKGSVAVRYNPGWVDYLQPGSFANSTWGSVLDYTMTVVG